MALFFFTFLMILREGIETVIFLSAVNVSSDAMVSFAGGIIGLLLPSFLESFSYGVQFVWILEDFSKLLELSFLYL